jgi:hypothetical protein
VTASSWVKSPRRSAHCPLILVLVRPPTQGSAYACGLQLRDETATNMRLLGAQSVAELGPRHLNSRAVERDLYDGPSGIDRGLEKTVNDVGSWVKSKL